jgi:hypothetical protein
MELAISNVEYERLLTSKATTVISAQASVKDNGSWGVTPTRRLANSLLRLHAAPQSQDTSYPNKPDSLHDHQTKHTTPRRTESETDAHFLPALIDGVSEDSIDADRGENDRKHREASDKEHDEPAPCN